MTLNTIDGNKIKLLIYYSLTVGKSMARSLTSERRNSQAYYAHKFVSGGCLTHFTRIDFNQRYIKHDILNGI
jgi:hypothetical protein